MQNFENSHVQVIYFFKKPLEGYVVRNYQICDKLNLALAIDNI